MREHSLAVRIERAGVALAQAMDKATADAIACSAASARLRKAWARAAEEYEKHKAKED